MLLADTENGLAIGIVMSALAILAKVAVPYVARLGSIHLDDETERQLDTTRFPQAIKNDAVAIVRFDGPLVFVNAQYFTNMIDRISSSSANAGPYDYLFESSRPPLVAPKVVIVDASCMGYVDTPGALAIEKAAESLHAKQIHFFMAGTRTDIKDTMVALNVLHGIDHHTFFLTVEDAATFVAEQGLTEKPYIAEVPAVPKAAAGDTALELDDLADAAGTMELMPSDHGHGINGGAASSDGAAGSAGSVILTLPDLDST